MFVQTSTKKKTQRPNKIPPKKSVQQTSFRRSKRPTWLISFDIDPVQFPLLLGVPGISGMQGVRGSKNINGCFWFP